MSFTIPEPAKKLISYFTRLGHFGNRNLEEEAKEVSLKMEQKGEKGVMKPSSSTNLSKEELEITAKDRTPG